MHKPSKNKFPRRKFITSGPGKIFTCDCAYMEFYEKANKGNKYLLVILDLYSRYLNVFPVKSLRAEDIVPALEQYLNNSIYDYSKIFTDDGVEFKSNAAQRLYKRFNIKHYSTFNKEIKAGIAERAIRTLKNKIGRFITMTNSEKYIHILPTICDT